jgi:hypothetical protein
MRTARGRDIRRCAAIVCFSSREARRSRQRMTSVTKSLQGQAPVPSTLLVCDGVTPHQNRVDGELIGPNGRPRSPSGRSTWPRPPRESLSRSSSRRRRNDSRQATSVTAKATVLRVGSTRLGAHTGSPPARTSASSRDVTPELLGTGGRRVPEEFCGPPVGGSWVRCDLLEQVEGGAAGAEDAASLVSPLTTQRPGSLPRSWLGPFLRPARTTGSG